MVSPRAASRPQLHTFSPDDAFADLGLCLPHIDALLEELQAYRNTRGDSSASAADAARYAHQLRNAYIRIHDVRLAREKGALAELASEAARLRESGPQLLGLGTEIIRSFESALTTGDAGLAATVAPAFQALEVAMRRSGSALGPMLAHLATNAVRTYDGVRDSTVTYEVRERQS